MYRSVYTFDWLIDLNSAPVEGLFGIQDKIETGEHCWNFCGSKTENAVVENGPIYATCSSNQ